MSTALDSLIDGYMRDLQRELRGFPASRKREILDEVGEHISQARQELDSESEAAIRTVLDRLGEPSEIAAAARERFGVRPAKAGGLEIATVIALVIPYFGWVAGSILVWMSRVWRTRDKVLATILVPGLWALFLMSLFVFSEGGTATGLASCRVEGKRTFCDTLGTQPGNGGFPWIGAAEILLFVIPVATAVYLAIRARRLSDATAVA